MKHIYPSLLAVLLFTLPTHAQNALIHHTIVHNPQHPPHSGRDFWFAAPSNEWGYDLGGKYMRVYITSAVNCTAYVECNSFKTHVDVQAYRVGTVTLPNYWETESSGEEESKAIHVYCTTADITVNFMSHQPLSGEGSLIIPTIGWGTDYVVAAYGSLFTGSNSYDLPSECEVVANQDNTQITITPSCDCRQCLKGSINGDSNASIVVYPQGEPASFTLNRGQDVQMMPVKASDGVNFDMTGTIIHANQPIGVMGASSQTTIPSNFPYANFVCEMIPPTRTWGETYYATNPIQPPGMPGHDFARYLLISSVKNQTIYRQDCQTGQHTECTIDNQYGIYWDELELGQKFYSTAPFMVAWYINSAQYPDFDNGYGSPAMCILTSQEQTPKTILFQTPQNVLGVTPYLSYANIIIDVNDEKDTRFDGQSILGKTSQCIDDIFEIFNIPNVDPLAHLISGDTDGVGVWVYGYGTDGSYAMSGAAPTGTYHSPDTVAPIVDTFTECDLAYVHVTDSGLLPDSINYQSLLSAVQADTAYNMSYTIDPNFIEGAGIDTTDYWMHPIDPTKPAELIMDIWDVAGNLTVVTSIYKPEIDSIKPAVQYFPPWISGTAEVGYDTLYNTGQTTFNISTLQLKYGNLGFSIYDSIGGPLDKTPIPPGERRVIMIKFEALTGGIAADTLLIGNMCLIATGAVMGSGGAADFMVSDQTWDVPYVPGVCYPKTVSITNLSDHPITLDTAWWADQVHFHPVSTFPVAIPALGKAQFTIDYCPDSSSTISPDTTQGTWFSDNVLTTDGKQDSPRFDNFTGMATAPRETFVGDIDTTINCVPVGDVITLNFTITATGTAPSIIKRVTQTNSNDFNDLTGILDNGVAWDPTKTVQQLAIGQSATISVQCTLPVGVDTTFTDYITANDGLNDTIGRTLKATVHATYSTVAVDPSFVDFGLVPFRTPDPSTEQTFTIQNTAQTPLTIYALVLQPGAAYNPAFTWTAANIPGNTPALFPDTLGIGMSLLVSADFNDSIFEVPLQTATLYVISDACAGMLTEDLIGSLSNAGVTMQVTPSLGATIVPAADGRSLEILFQTTMNDPANFELVNVLGQSVLRSAFTAGASTQTVDAGALPFGVYFYRLTSGAFSQRGKIILGE